MPWKIDLGSLENPFWYEPDALWAFSADEGIVAGGGNISLTGWSHVSAYTTNLPLPETTQSFRASARSAVQHAISNTYASGIININRSVKNAFFNNNFTLSYWINVVNPSSATRSGYFPLDFMFPLFASFPIKGNLLLRKSVKGFNLTFSGSGNNTASYSPNVMPQNQWVKIRIQYEKNISQLRIYADETLISTINKVINNPEEIATVESFRLDMYETGANAGLLSVQINQCQLVPRLI